MADYLNAGERHLPESPPQSPTMARSVCPRMDESPVAAALGAHGDSPSWLQPLAPEFGPFGQGAGERMDDLLAGFLRNHSAVHEHRPDGGLVEFSIFEFQTITTEHRFEIRDDRACEARPGLQLRRFIVG